MNKKDFIPAAHYHSLTPFYGWFMKLFFKGRYRKISDFVHLASGENLLDVGCGSGMMLNLMHQKYPDHELIGLDVDSAILAIAKQELPNSIRIIESSAAKIPLPDQSVNVVMSTLMIHHLTSEERRNMIQEVYRILRPGGRFFLFDFAKPTNLWGKFFTSLFRKIEHLDDALKGKYSQWIKETGFQDLQAIYATHGMMTLIKAIKS